MKNLLVIFLSFYLLSCNGEARKTYNEGLLNQAEKLDVNQYDEKRGEGDFKNVELEPIDMEKVKRGKAIYDVKCHSCHKLTDEKLVGPGWAGVTDRHKPEWILNFITNPDAMIDKDPKLLAQLEICLIRMPNQDIDKKEAYDVLDFMRHNDLNSK